VLVWLISPQAPGPIGVILAIVPTCDLSEWRPPHLSAAVRDGRLAAGSATATGSWLSIRSRNGIAASQARRASKQQTPTPPRAPPPPPPPPPRLRPPAPRSGLSALRPPAAWGLSGEWRVREWRVVAVVSGLAAGCWLLAGCPPAAGKRCSRYWITPCDGIHMVGFMVVVYARTFRASGLTWS
jgi:hypothetical protein